LAARYKVPLGISTMSTTPMEDLLTQSEGNAWFQLYFSGDGESSFKLAERAQTAGFETLILTVDVPEVGRRPRELAHNFKMPFRIGPRQFIDFACHPRWSLSSLFHGKPRLANFDLAGFTFDRTESRARADWATLSKLRDLWRGKLVVKGVLNAQDAARLMASGVDAIQVSSHGARQLESAPAPFERLQDIRNTVGPNVPIFYDSGLRSGEDVLKTLNQGADFTFLGRILLFAIAARGEEGLHELWSVLSQELSIAMAQTGRTSLV
ncbi:MAG: alpha-hydroxy-acid oxidizing protein, partial [Rhodobacteraceae bacterium]|nr:alpha-hydroxy-acid oxidizing protein [Paracoccaceae bacterium]